MLCSATLRFAGLSCAGGIPNRHDGGGVAGLAWARVFGGGVLRCGVPGLPCDSGMTMYGVACVRHA